MNIKNLTEVIKQRNEEFNKFFQGINGGMNDEPMNNHEQNIKSHTHATIIAILEGLVEELEGRFKLIDERYEQELRERVRLAYNQSLSDIIQSINQTLKEIKE